MRVVRDDENELVSALQQGERAGLVDARVLDLIDQHDGAVADQRDIRDHQRARLSAAEQVQAVACGNGLGRDGVGDGDDLIF